MVGGQPVPGKRLAPPWRAHEADPVMAVPRPEHAKPGGSASPGGPASQHFRGTMTVAADEPSASQDDRYSDAVAVFTELTRALAEDESVPETLQSILALVLRLVPGCHAASVTVLDEKGVPGTIAATGEETYQMDRRQYELHDGPCLDAARHQQVNRWNLAEAEQRWPDFTRLAKEMGLRSYLSTGLGWAGRPLGALNLSSRDADGFDQLDERLMSLFTAPAAAAIVVARRYSEARGLAAQLEQALLSGGHRPGDRDHHGRVTLQRRGGVRGAGAGVEQPQHEAARPRRRDRHPGRRSAFRAPCGVALADRKS